MSINITVRPNGATTGGRDQVISGEGDIDTKEEAEAALAYLPEGSTETVTAGSRTYTRAQLVEIRDRAAIPAAPEKTASGEGVSHGAALEGYALRDSGDLGHGGGGARLSYRAGVPMAKKGDHRLNLDLIAGLDASRYTRGFSTPGGEDVASAYNNMGVFIGADARYITPLLDRRIAVSLGVRAGAGSLSTKDNAEISTPGKCTPGDLGRAECEPSAGARTGNAGTQGLYNPRVGSARSADGVVLSLDIPLLVSGTVVRDSWGSIDLFAGPMLGVRKVMPSDGDGFRYTSLGGAGGIVVRFGGADSEVRPATGTVAPPPPAAATPPVADKDGDGVPDSEDKCPDVKGVKDNAGCPPYEAGVTSSPASVKAEEKFLVGIKVGTASKVRVTFKSEDGTLNNANSVLADEGNSKSEFQVPAGLKAGKYKLVVTFEDMNTHAKKVEEKDIVIVENVTATLPGSFAPGQPPTIQNARVGGMEKLEGVTYTIEGFKDKQSIGTLDSASLAKGDKSWTLDEKKGTRIPLAAPGGKGFQREVNYVVTLKNKEGLPVWTSSFEVGVVAPGGRKVKPK